MENSKNYITYHTDFVQGSDEWYDARRGFLTASEIKYIITPTKLQYACNDKERSHLYELVAQRISGFTEPSYVSDDMLRGQFEEFYARKAYEEHIAPVTEVGFVTNNKWGFTIGCSPDGLVGEDGMIEIKSRRQKFQVETIIADEIPAEYVLQVQASLLVTERSWLDYLSYHGGLPLFPKRIYPDDKILKAIVEVAGIFEQKIQQKMAEYQERIAAFGDRLIVTERRSDQEIGL